MISILGDTEAIAKLGARLRTERLRRNLSQDHMCKVLGITIPTYRKIESGDGTVEFRHVARALGMLGYSDAIGELIPETKPEMRLEDLLLPERKHASRPRRQ
ncbi:MAG: helix-turn-helix transcriptional regulator [Methylacidiphilales bacterium]|nr:helix-turn-helix transcriptional regulator [Candidatus Methylacidiphilales bacterium]